MPRHRPNAQPQAPAVQATFDSPAIPGGAAGIPMSNELSTRPVAHDMRNDPGRNRRAKEWMVVDGPRDGSGAIPFQSDGYRVAIRPGKIVSEATHNLDLMRRQGIKLEAMPDGEEAPPEDEQDAIAAGELDDEVGPTPLAVE